MNFHPIHLALTLIVAAAAGWATFGSAFRARMLAAWVASLALACLFLLLKNELIAFALGLLSTGVTWVVLAQTLVFGDFQTPREAPLGWRNHLMPALGALMLLGMIYLGTPASVFEEIAFPEPAPLVLSDLGARAMGRFFLLAVIVAAVSFAAVVGVGMIARAEWRREGGDH